MLQRGNGMSTQYKKLSSEKLHKILDELQSKDWTCERDATSKDIDVRGLEKLLHDLQVYQVELEMQNRELQEMQVKLERSRDRYADLYDFAPVGYTSLDRNGIILDLNLTAALSLGQERSKLIGTPFAIMLSPNQIKRFIDHLRKAASATEIQKEVAEFTLKDSHGTRPTLRFESVAYFDEDLGQTIVRSAMMDITELKQAESNLRAAHASLKTKVAERTADLNYVNQLLHQESIERRRLDDRLRQAGIVFENTQEAIVFADIAAKIVAVNRAFSFITGYQEDEIKGQSIYILNSDQVNGSYEQCRVILRRTGQWRGETNMRRKNGEIFAAWQSISAVKDREEKVTNYVAVFCDISSIKNTYSVRMRLDLGVGELVTTMWGTTFGSGSDSSIHLLGPDHAAVRRRQGGTGQFDLAPEVLLLITGRQSLQALFMPIKIQLRKGFGQAIQ
jgi:PAS domain S-box-containing protein